MGRSEEDYASDFLAEAHLLQSESIEYSNRCSQEIVKCLQQLLEHENLAPEQIAVSIFVACYFI